MMIFAHLIAFHVFLFDINNMRLINLQMIVNSMLYLFLIFNKTIIKFIIIIWKEITEVTTEMNSS